MYLSGEVRAFLDGINKNSLYLVSIPTGFGKTTGVREFIKNTGQKVIYTVHLKDLLKDVKNEVDFILKSDIDTVRENISKVKKDSVLESIESFKKIKELYNVKGAEESLQFYISRLQRDLKQRYLKGENIINDVEVLFPSVRIEKYHKIATTTQKLISGFFHFKRGTFLKNEDFKDAFLFIDEFNLQKSKFLDVLARKENECEIIELYRSFRSALEDGILEKYDVSKEKIKDIKKKFKKNYPQFTSREDFGIYTEKEVNFIADKFLFESFYENIDSFKEIKTAINSFLGVLREIYRKDIGEGFCKILTQSVTTKEEGKNYRYVYNFLKNLLKTKPPIGTTLLEDLYEEGFNHLRVQKDSGLDEFYLHSFSLTPEKFIKDLSEWYKVVGISATAHIKSIVRNFDLDYLEVKESFKHVDLNIKDNTEVEVIKPEEVDDVFIMDSISYRDEYLQNRFLKFCNVYEKFLQSDMKSFLYLQSSYLDNEFKDLIKTAKERLNKKHSKECEVFILREKDKYEEFVKNIKEEKFFIISVYQNVGVGANLHYKHKNELKDIDGIYLGEITNLIPTDNKISSIYYLLSLYHKNDFSKKDLKKSLKSLFTMESPHIHIIPAYKKSDDYVNAVMDFVIQAIGRLFRVNKEAKKYIFISHELYEQIEYFEYDGITLPVIKKLTKKRKPPKTDKELIKNSLDAWSKINYMISSLDGCKEEYTNIREYIFKHPFCDNPEYKVFYAKTGRYFYKEDNDYRQIDISFTKKDGYIEVSKEAGKIELINEMFGFEIQSEGKYALIPIAWNNFFKGIVGEKIVKSVFSDLGIELEGLEEGFEKFDFKYKDYFFDAKNYSQINIESKDIKDLIAKYEKRLRNLNGKKGFILNIFGYAPDYKINKIQKFGDIIVVPYLIDVEKKELNKVAINYLRELL